MVECGRCGPAAALRSCVVQTSFLWPLPLVSLEPLGLGPERAESLSCSGRSRHCGAGSPAPDLRQTRPPCPTSECLGGQRVGLWRCRTTSSCQARAGTGSEPQTDRKVPPPVVWTENTAPRVGVWTKRRWHLGPQCYGAERTASVSRDAA